MSKSLKNTIVIFIILIISAGLGFAFDKIALLLEKRAHPMPEEYREIVKKYSELYGVEQYIVYSVIKAESGFRSDVVSSAGAVGLMQITEDTFDTLMRRMGENLSKGLLYDPHTNIKYGTYYLNYLYK